jgi:hypothetical protein
VYVIEKGVLAELSEPFHCIFGAIGSAFLIVESFHENVNLVEVMVELTTKNIYVSPCGRTVGIYQRIGNLTFSD